MRLFFAGDLGQRIFQQPFSWKSLGRRRPRPVAHPADQLPHIPPDPDLQADRLLGHAVTDVDGNAEKRARTVSVFNGPPPMVIGAP